MARTRSSNRSAVSGRFVTREQARRNPRETVSETRQRRSRSVVRLSAKFVCGHCGKPLQPELRVTTSSSKA